MSFSKTAFGLLLALLLCAPSLGCRPKVDLPKLAPVPAFEMRDQDDQPITERDLRGKVSIVSFMFTTCPDVCPLLTAKLSVVRTKLLAQRPKLTFVSITVDPKTDTPAKLKAFAREHNADYPDWRFLTGPAERLRDVVVGGFKQSIELGESKPGAPPNILHGTHCVLVDRAGFIRGYYSNDEPGHLLLARDARLLIAEKAQP